jgi:hypothetical protein
VGLKGEPEMQKKTLILTSEGVQALPARERVGLVMSGFPETDAATQALVSQSSFVRLVTDQQLNAETTGDNVAHRYTFPYYRDTI